MTAGRKITLLPLLFCLLLWGCGGTPGGGVGADGLPIDPDDTDTTDITINYNTLEYRNSYSLDLIGAISAYDQGATGAGITVAVIDSGIDRDNPELAANIHPSSTNIFTGNAADLDDTHGHGSAVSAIVAAVRDPTSSRQNNMHGVAFDSQILALNTASNQDCDSTEGCNFFDSDIAAALDYARLNGAKIVNISLGGDSPNSGALVAAYRRAVEAGMLIVVAAGNKSETDSAADISQPKSSTATAIESWAGGQIIIAGSVNRNKVISDFSHRAGNAAKEVFLVAPGEEILAPGLNDQGAAALYLWSGTSFSTPHIAGAAALLMSAFPNLDAADIAALLFETSTDLGDSGTDSIYGQGLINLTEAFRPQGTTSVAVKTATGATAIVALDDSIILGGGAFGNLSEMGTVLENSMIMDSYQRPFHIDLGQRLYTPEAGIQIAHQLSRQDVVRRHRLALSPIAHLDLSWVNEQRFQTVNTTYFAHQNEADNPVRDLRLKLNYSMGDNRPALTISQGLSVREMLEDYNQDDFLTIGREGFTALMGRDNSRLIHLRPHSAQTFKVNFVIGQSRQTNQNTALDAVRTLVMSRFEHKISPSIKTRLNVGILHEKGSVLGSLSSGALALGQGASTAFVGGRLDWALGPLRVFTRFTYGRTAVKAAPLSLIRQIDNLTASSFSVGFSGQSLFQAEDRLSLALSQPLRVTGGTARMSYATSRDFDQNFDTALTFSQAPVALSPTGRALDMEISYRMAYFLGATIDINLLHQINPGHNRQAPDNNALLIRFGSQF